jgi:hypothetical protein
MTNNANLSFSAKDASLGYSFQTIYALLHILEENEEASIAIEKLDDIELLSAEGKTIELVQLKHHIKKIASLSDTSIDLWKTIRIWSTYIINGTIVPSEVKLLLITTATASDDSIARRLSPKSKNRDNKQIARELLEITTTSTNKDLEEAFNVYKSLNESQREQLIDSIVILDNSPDIIDTEKKIKNKLICVKPENVDPLYERLLGWWMGLIVKSFTSPIDTTIPRKLVLDKVASIAEQFLPDALPIDFFDAIPPSSFYVDIDNRMFVKQLKTIQISSKRIQKAILDYYRAYQQRIKWVDDNLIIDEDLENYEKRLIDEWERYYEYLKDEPDFDDSTNEKCIEIGKKVYGWVELEADFPIRKNVTEPYVMRGSYQILANILPLKVWWHPNFIEQIVSTLSINE